MPLSSLVLLKCLRKGVKYLINSHSLGSRWQMQRTNPAGRWDPRGLQQVPADLGANSDPSVLVEGKRRDHEALRAVLRENFLPKTNSNEINYSVFSGHCRDGRIRLCFQCKWELVNDWNPTSVWQHSPLVLLRLMTRCYRRLAPGLSHLLAPPQTNTHTCMDWMLMDLIVYAKTSSTLQDRI